MLSESKISWCFNFLCPPTYTFGSVTLTLFGEALFLQCTGRWGSLCRKRNSLLQPSRKTPSTQTPQKNPSTLVSWNSTTDKVCLLFHFPKDIFCFSGEKGGVSLESSERSERSGSLQAQRCYACFTAFLLLTVVLLNAKRRILKH